MSPPGQLLQLPLPPPLPHGTSTRVIASRRKTMSKSIVEACEANKSFLTSVIDKKEYSRTLLVDDGSAEGARSANAFRPTPHSEAMKTEGNVFRRFKTRKDTILPTFDKWRPAIRERFLLPAHHSSRANSELNDMIEYYERMLLDRERDVIAWKDKFSSLESDLCSSTEVKQKLEDQLDNLFSELMKSNGELQDQYQRYDKIQEELSNARGRLSESRFSAYDLSNQLSELQAKYKAIAKLRDAKLARLASKARKEVKGRGMELIQRAIVFIQTEKTRTKLESDIKEYESNLLLLDQTHDEDFSEKQERSELEAVLTEKRSRLAALPSSSFNHQQFEEFFTESPALSESGLDWAVIPWNLRYLSCRWTLLTVAIAPEIPPSTNTETVVIEDNDGSNSRIPTE
ncbi:hypothetical protein AXX17_AT3G33750 [Arabidopsis thaliana]|uniref:Uncharacterized protein n=2 Tax=Arabidopsis TaxID=3701 RepID=A0A178VCS4_ARATH|nr:hypothetical protein AXX17_AT3G33750 [Arabidopsis thaliana]